MSDSEAGNNSHEGESEPFFSFVQDQSDNHDTSLFEVSHTKGKIFLMIITIFVAEVSLSYGQTILWSILFLAFLRMKPYKPLPRFQIRYTAFDVVCTTIITNLIHPFLIGDRAFDLWHKKSLSLSDDISNEKSSEQIDLDQLLVAVLFLLGNVFYMIFITCLLVTRELMYILCVVECVKYSIRAYHACRGYNVH